MFKKKAQRTTSKVVLQLTEQDAITLDAAYQGGLMIFGGPGAGKSTGPMHQAVANLMRMGAGMLFCTVKRSDAQTYASIAKACGREADVRKICPGGHKMDLIQTAVGMKGGIDTGVELLDTLMELQQRKEGKGDAFFTLGSRRLFQRILHLLHPFSAVLGAPSLRLIEAVLVSAPVDDLANDPAWRATSDCVQMLALAERMPKTSELTRSIEFFQREWPQMADKTRTSIQAVAQNCIDSLLSGSVGDAIASGKTTVYPRELEEGRIIITDYPKLEYFAAGGLINAGVKHLCIKHLLGREVTASSLPCVIVEDECQETITPGLDAAARAVGRSQKMVFLAASQNIAGLIAALGEHSRAEVMQYLACMQSLLFCQNADMAETNAYASKLIGEGKTMFLNLSSGGQDNQYDPVNEFLGLTRPSGTASLNTTIRPLVPPERFASLKQGGPHCKVETVVYSGGRRFSNGLPYLICDIPQVFY